LVSVLAAAPLGDAEVAIAGFPVEELLG
jgi:hypothetical protein